jgi:hypothetical protein
MSDHDADEFDSDINRKQFPHGTLSSNGQWLFGSLYAALTLVGFSFGVWAGASKPKPVEVAEVKKEPEKPAPVVTPPVVKPPVVEPKPKEPEPKPVEPEPKPMTPEVKPKEPEPKPKEPEPKPKLNVKPVAFKEVAAIFRSYCANCHGAVGKPKGDVDLRTVAAIMKGGSAGDIVTPGQPDKSALYLSIKMNTMPPEGKGPSPAELQVIHDWIASGAKERRRTVRGRRGPRR